MGVIIGLIVKLIGGMCALIAAGLNCRTFFGGKKDATLKDIATAIIPLVLMVVFTYTMVIQF